MDGINSFIRAHAGIKIFGKMGLSRPRIYHVTTLLESFALWSTVATTLG